MSWFRQGVHSINDTITTIFLGYFIRETLPGKCKLDKSSAACEWTFEADK